MTASESRVVLELFSRSHAALVHLSDGSASALGLPSAAQGLCHSLLVGQAQHLVAGVVPQGLFYPGEVVT